MFETLWCIIGVFTVCPSSIKKGSGKVFDSSNGCNHLPLKYRTLTSNILVWDVIEPKEEFGNSRNKLTNMNDLLN